MNNKDKALHTAFEAFYSMMHGAIYGPKEFEYFADMCALALPMKYRWCGEELEALRYAAGNDLKDAEKKA
jgi:hypothetical protein